MEVLLINGIPRKCENTAAALVSCAWAGGTAAIDCLHRYFVPSQMPVIDSNDYTVFQGTSVKDKDTSSIELLQNARTGALFQLRKSHEGAEGIALPLISKITGLSIGEIEKI